MSKELFLKYYQDHASNFDDLQLNLVLHLHVHFDQLFDHHGSLCYLGTFGQEDLMGAISKSYNGTRFHGQIITYHYEVSRFSLTFSFIPYFNKLVDRFCPKK